MADATIWASGTEQVPGPKGDAGPPGPVNSLAIGTVTQGVTASATITGDAPSQTLNLVIPKGDTGEQGIPGPANSLSIGSVDSGVTAAASITGETPTQTLNLTFPLQQFNVIYGACFGFADSYLLGADLTGGVDLVWTTIKMDPAGLFTVPSSATIVVPPEWNNLWIEIRVNITQQESVGTEASTTSPVTSKKLVISHTRGAVTTKWRSSGAGAFTLGAKECASGPVKVQTGDTIKVTYYTSSSSSSGLGVNSYLYIKPVGILVPA